VTAPVYSKQFFQQIVIAGPSVPPITVPAGKVWIISNVVTWQTAGAGNDVLIRRQSDGLVLVGVSCPSSILPGTFTGHIVLNPGDQWNVQAQGANANVGVYGYELTIP